MSNFTSLFNLNMAFDYKVFSLCEEYPYLFECIKNEYKEDNEVNLRKAIKFIVIKYETSTFYKYFNPIYFERLKELRKIKMNKTYSDLVEEFYNQTK